MHANQTAFPAAPAGQLASPGTTVSVAEPPGLQPPSVARAAGDREPWPLDAFPMTGAEVFARVCQDEGVGALFCMPGNYKIIHAVAASGTPVFSGRTEAAMAHAADAFVRVTGEVALCSAHRGPGLTGMTCGIACASAARTPMLIVAAGTGPLQDDSEEGIQGADQQPTTEGLRKYGKRITEPSRVYEYAGYAFRHLRTGVPRPVHLDFAPSVTDAVFQDGSALTGFYRYSQYRTDARPHPSPQHIAAAVDLLKRARRPMIVASNGVFYARAWDALRRFAERTQTPVVESGAMKGQFSDAHPLSANMSPGALPRADLVLLIGQHSMPGKGDFAFHADARYIRIDPAPEDIGRNLPIDVGIVSCERAALDALTEAAPRMVRDEWLAEIAAARRNFEAENDGLYRQGLAFDDAIHPAVLAKDLADFMYDGDIPREQTTVVSGGYGVARYVRRWLRGYRPGQIMNGAYQYGAVGPDIGYAVGAAVGAQLGVGTQAGWQGHPVICVTGDAGFGYTGMELETLTRYRLPAIVIVYNNNASGTWWQARDMSPSALSMHLFQENLRYDKLAEALGAHGEYVMTPPQFRAALDRAYRVAVNERRPVLINCQGRKEFWTMEPGFLPKVEPGCMSYYH